MSKKGLGKFVLGAGIGAGLALLFAPKKGSDLRRDIKRKFDEFMKDVDKIEIEDIKESFTKKVDEIKKETHEHTEGQADQPVEVPKDPNQSEQ